MKKYLIVLTAVFLILTACSQEVIEPPELIVDYGNGQVTAVTGTYGWTENSKHIEADSDTPPNIVSFQENELILSQEDTLNLVFKKIPNDVQVNIWKNDEVLKQELNNNKFTVPNEVGNVVYEIVVDYEQGTVHYALEVIIEN